MAISGKQNIDIGLPNESANSDSLYEAFTKIDENFDTLFANSSQYDTFQSGNGISVSSNSVSGTVTITNTGVTGITAGTNIVVDRNDGVVTISSTGGGGAGGTVTSVGIVGAAANARIGVSGPNPIVSSGTFTIDLQNSGVSAGTYTYPTLTVDQYGRVTNIANANSVGTVTSVAIAPGAGIQVTNSPITTNGTISIVNTGVTKLIAGDGIELTNPTGEVTITSVNQGGSVNSVAISSSTLVIGGTNPIINSGTISINLPSNITAVGSLSSSTLTVSGNSNLANINTTGSITASGQIRVATTLSVFGNSNVSNLAASGSITATSNLRSSNLSVTSNASIGNITTGSIAVSSSITTPTLVVTGNSNIGNLGVGGSITATDTILGGNLTTGGTLNVSGNSNISNVSVTGLITATGAIQTSTTLSSVGNANVGNLGTSGLITATGNIRGGNLISLGVLSMAGNANVGNLGLTGLITATGGIFTNSLLSVAGNSNVGNLGTSGLITATGNIRGGNLISVGMISAVGNANIGNLGTTRITATDSIQTSSTLSAVGNATLGNVITGGLISSTGAIQTGSTLSAAGNITTGGIISATGAIRTNSTLSVIGTATVGNLTTDGVISATGNLNISSISASGVINITGNTQSSIAGDLSMSGKNIINLANPINPQDAATKSYTDSIAQGLYVKNSVRLATSVALSAYTYNNGASGVGATITSATAGQLIIDGSTVLLNDRVLIKNEGVGNSSPYNGIYVVTVAGDPSTAWVLTRSDDFNQWNEIPGAFVFIEIGVVNGDTGWVCTSDSGGTVGVTPIVFTQFSGAGTYSAGTGLTLTGTTFSVNNNQSQITGVGTLSSLSVSGNSNIANLGVTGTVTASGNISSSNNLITTGSGGNIIMSGGNITGVNNISANSTITTGSGGNIVMTGGNISGANNISSNTISASGNISGSYILGNGSQLTGITIIPTGVITMWYGSVISIPSGWYLCDGSNGTPDLRNRFVIGAGSSYVVGATGGSKDAVVVSHSHSISDPGHNHSVPSGGYNPSSYSDRAGVGPWQDAPQTTGTSVTGISINTTGESGTDKNLPPYYALCYIMKA